MRALRFAFFVSTAAGLILAGRYVVSARQAPSVITACVQNLTGSLRISPTGSCKGNESLLEWNLQGPAGPAGAMGPMGPAGPAGTPPAGTGDLRVVDSQGTTVGQWQSPGYVSLTVNAEIVFVGLDLAGRSFVKVPPTYYYTDAACSTSPMMYLDMTHYGVVQNGVLSWATGTAIATSYGSFNNNNGTGCQSFGGPGTFGAIATSSVAGLVAPFSLAH